MGDGCRMGELILSSSQTLSSALFFPCVFSSSLSFLQPSSHSWLTFSLSLCVVMLLTSSPSQSNGTVWHYALRHHEAVFHPDGELPLMTLFCLYSAYFSLINSLIKLTLIFLLFNYPCLFPSSVSENIKLLYEPVMLYLLYLHLLHLPVCSRPCCYPAHGLPISPLSDSL